MSDRTVLGAMAMIRAIKRVNFDVIDTFHELLRCPSTSNKAIKRYRV
jgi:hypothetical protein